MILDKNILDTSLKSTFPWILSDDIPLVLPILWPYLLKSCGMCNGLGPENKSFVHNYLELKTCIGGVIAVNEQCACIF